MQALNVTGLNDSRGISWRIKNQIRRFDFWRSLRILRGLCSNPRHERPVFILGAPRSGTTLLFRLLGQCPELGHLPREGHIMWRMFHHPRYGGWKSDAIAAGQVRLGERRFINAYLKGFFGQRRFVEKTPENCLRIPYLLDLFPDAHFVVIKRNPCDVVNSLLNGWRDEAGRYRSYYVPKDLSIPGHPHRRQWRFALLEGWQELSSSPMQRIALEQWRQCVLGIQAGRALVPRERWSELHLESLLQAPESSLRRILERIDATPPPGFYEQLEATLAQPVNALSAQRPDKWRHENREALTPLLPSMVETARASGYLLDPETGQCSPLEELD